MVEDGNNRSYLEYVESAFRHSHLVKLGLTPMLPPFHPVLADTSTLPRPICPDRRRGCPRCEHCRMSISAPHSMLSCIHRVLLCLGQLALISTESAIHAFTLYVAFYIFPFRTYH